MISRLALYHRWRRFQVISFTYPLLLLVATMAAGIVLWVIATPG